MNKSVARKFSANEQEIAELLKENTGWKNSMAGINEEIHFLNLYLRGDIFDDDRPELYEKLEKYMHELENLKAESIQLSREIHNHRYDIEGMMECEDISCEVFYHEEHIKLEKQMENLKEKLNFFRRDLFAYTGNALRKFKE